MFINGGVERELCIIIMVGVIAGSTSPSRTKKTNHVRRNYDLLLFKFFNNVILSAYLWLFGDLLMFLVRIRVHVLVVLVQLIVEKIIIMLSQGINICRRRRRYMFLSYWLFLIFVNDYSAINDILITTIWHLRGVPTINI